MQFKLAKISDVQQMLQIVQENYSSKWAKLARREIEEMFSSSSIRPDYVVAEEKGKILGFAGFIESWMDYNIYEIFWVNVANKFQHKGIATELVKNLISRIKKFKGIRKAKLITLSTKVPELYKKLGFKILPFKTTDKHSLMVLKMN